MEGGDGRFLAAMLGAGTREHAANLADQRALDEVDGASQGIEVP